MHDPDHRGHRQQGSPGRATVVETWRTVAMPDLDQSESSSMTNTVNVQMSLIGLEAR